MQPRPRAAAPRRLHRVSSGCTCPRLILLVADVLHPVDRLAVESFLNGDMGHGRGGRGAVPVLFAGLEPDHVTRPDLLDRTTLALHPAAAERNDEDLAERVRVPCGARGGLKRDG